MKGAKHIKLSFIFAFVIFGTISITMIITAVMIYFRTMTYIGFVPVFPWLRILYPIGFCLLLGFLIERVVNKKIFKPLNQLKIAMKQVSEGHYDYRIIQNNELGEIKEMYKHFNTMAEELGQVELLRNDFVRSVSHEFKTPLAAIEGYATLINGTDIESDERIEYSDLILKSTKRLTKLSDNILKLSKLEQNNRKIEKKKFDLAEQIRAAIILLEPLWSDKEIDWSIDLIEMECVGNEDLLFQVWTNLLHNVIKFSHIAGTLEIGSFLEFDTFAIVIKDSGVGMSPSQQKHIFEKFYQADSSRTTDGNGLGLALVKKIIDLHEGSINVESEPNEGTTFTIILPI